MKDSADFFNLKKKIFKRNRLIYNQYFDILYFNLDMKNNNFGRFSIFLFNKVYLYYF